MSTHMRARLVAGAGALALLTGLALSAQPAHGVAAETRAEGCDRNLVVEAWATGGTRVTEAAAAALLGTDAQVCEFLEDDLVTLQAIDDRAAVNRIKSGGGPQVASAANDALLSSEDGAIREFLTSGWEQPSIMDQRVRVLQMKDAGGVQLRSAAQAALNADSSDALDQFMESGWITPHHIDQRAAVNRAKSSGGPQVRDAAQRALDNGTMQALTRFIDVDWAVAQARDNEVQTLTDLRAAATQSGKRATIEMTAAVAQMDRAVTEAEQARIKAQEARDLAAEAGHATAEARGHARAAGQWAERAANAAERAIRSARAAADAAREAAAAAGRAATAAARAGHQASVAGAAAAQAELYRDRSDEALAAAQNAEFASQHVRPITGTGQDNPLYWVDQMVTAYQTADELYGLVTASTQQAGDAAAAAAGYAGEASEEAQYANAAASRARANADRARQATQQAASCANAAATAAVDARTAAEQAVSHAEAAAAAARDAASHAGEAVDAAERATTHANNAWSAAQDAVNAATTAQRIYTQARAADEARIQDELDQGLAAARAARAAVKTIDPESLVSLDGPMSQYHTQDLDGLIAAVKDPDTEPATATEKARLAAMELVHVPGTWTSKAALEALGSPDGRDVVEFIANRLPGIEGKDDRTTLLGLMVVGSDAYQTAAQAALNGTDADVAAFLNDPVYPERAIELRAEVNRILSAAEASEETAVTQSAEAALTDGSIEVLNDFVQTGHAIAKNIDVRAAVNQIASSQNSGVELRNAAQIALAGTPSMLVNFLEVGRHLAAQRDYATATHSLVASSLMIQTAQIAQQAVETAKTAQEAAAIARGAAHSAIEYAEDAEAAGRLAAQHALEAIGHAEDAARSAQSAAESVRRAADAAKEANNSARRATASAVWARASAVQAASYADQAADAYQRAYDAQIAIGENRDKALQIAQDAYNREYYRAIDAITAAFDSAQPDCEALEEGQDECLQRLSDLMNDPEGYAAKNLKVCQSTFAPQSREFRACAAATLSPVFSRAVQEIDLMGTGDNPAWLDSVNAVGDASQAVAGSVAGVEGSLILRCPVVVPGCGTAIVSVGAVAFGSEVVALGAQAMNWIFGDDDDFTHLIGSDGRVRATYFEERIEAMVINRAIEHSQLAVTAVNAPFWECTDALGPPCPYNWIEDITPIGPTKGYIADGQGMVLAANGLPIPDPPPRDDLSAWAQYLRQSGTRQDLDDLRDRVAALYANRFGIQLRPPANHLETQLAFDVARRAVSLDGRDVRVVINNANGVCAPLDGPQIVPACIQAIQMLLPRGTTMTIYYPNPADLAGNLLQMEVRGLGDWQEE